MCGIAGFLGRFGGEVGGRLLGQLGAALAHRGPDGHGTWTQRVGGGAACVGLAHARLSIIDTSNAASQPMHGVGGRYTTVFNGEIYNYKRLVGPLVAAGYELNVKSDTAVLAPLWHQHGVAALPMLEGMWAWGMWDAQAQTLTLVRDHAGIKPLYYAVTAAGLVFASELKALVGVRGVDLTPDAAALGDYMTLLWSAGARTPVRGIKKLCPGHWLAAKVGESGVVEVKIGRWYAPPQAQLVDGKPVYDWDKTPAQLLELLDAVVAEQCTSDVPVGAFLSGGVDSSALVASMVATGNKPTMTYCVGFEGVNMAAEGFGDDMGFAKSVAGHLGVPFAPVWVNPAETLAKLPTLAWLLDEPTADVAPLFVQAISQQARADGVKVLLGGAGGDDVASGYRRHTTARLRQWLGRGQFVAGMSLSGLGKVLPARGKFMPLKRRLRGLGSLLMVDDATFLNEAFMTNSHVDAWQLLHPDLRGELAGGWTNALDAAAAESEGQDLLNRLLYNELFGFLPDHNLNYNDKAAMVAGVEGRVPYIDKRVMAWLADVPPSRKMVGLHAKAFLKDAVAPRLPRAVLTRSKAGFGAPIRHWLTVDGRDMVESALFDDGGAGVMDGVALRAFWDRFLRGEVDGAYTVLAACMMRWWWDGLKV